MKTNVLIFGGGSYNALQVYFSLKDTVCYHPILASGVDNHSTFVSCDAVIDLPYDSDPRFIDALNRCIAERDIRFVIPTHDTGALRLMEHEDEINAVVVCSSLETTRICRYKSLTYEKLAGLDFVPRTYRMEDEQIEFPIFAKDDAGQGGRNAFRIADRAALDCLPVGISYVLCEYLPGEEITVDCFTDRHGELRFVQPRSRARLLNGISARAEIIPLTEEIQEMAEAISRRISFRGYWFMQCKKDLRGRYKLMEISTRFAGSFGITRNLDVNLPLMALADFSDMDVAFCPNPCKIVGDKAYIDRYRIDYAYDRVYIDFDDTLVFDRKRYNTEAMRFLYQCLNQEKRLVLITKHAYDLRQTAAALRFDLGLFDEIIEVPPEQMKYEYMDNTVPSIFIDNAFAERMQVKEKLGMPAFDISNIEALIDWSM